MKRYALILVLSLAVWCSACHPARETAPISGTLTDAGNDTLIVTCYPLVPPGEGVAHSDTLVMHDGTFAYTRKEVARQWDDKMYFFPIPQADKLKNPNLGQNPGWGD